MIKHSSRLTAASAQALAFFSSFALLTAASALLAGSAQAEFYQTYVSATATDVPDCSSPANACYTFDKAIRQTKPGGRIFVISSGSYIGAFIDKSLTISAPWESRPSSMPARLGVPLA